MSWYFGIHLRAFGGDCPSLLKNKWQDELNRVNDALGGLVTIWYREKVAQTLELGAELSSL